ncbi:mannose-6-phosphate isomerase (macronuclear) [Tetrahymena thermophila SB210]|uniref:mannose-6-phosphate isomerase n=1 Tax=Tetrahymena thermophila (strain SB210) TaxID=312017 RepID=I7MMI6_TETTS|nr:mannose-6-phosphate isomerase [Tetrahymena thermophila SB210]EAS04929.1 mannose-6-phosphate isomerase [Tetrahymena thermophila SB210]|eukprot:XP_001025174.1 mannose-6-phosphate isomerase [Tetrahymena thermophila SB210]
MDKINKKLFKILAGYQNYEWGKIGESSQVYQMVKCWNESLQLNQAYAELWMGTHVNCPSIAITENNQKVKLGDLIATQPDAYLGKEVKEKYNLQDQLPFLFKILSVNKALSIQAHPDIELAKKLFKEFPNIYKDPNHKPEMCIALTDYEALCNFCKADEIVENLKATPELKEVINNQELIDKFVSNKSKEDLKSIFTALFDASQDHITEQVKKLINRVQLKQDKNERDLLVIKLNEQYPNDVGIFVSYLLNYFKMKEGDCLVMAANEPHAYISGDCIECMAASDNVVRAGLTPKFKDKVTLCNMLTYEMKDPSILRQKVTFEDKNKGQIIELYSPEDYKDFSCLKISSKEGDLQKTVKLESGSIFIVIQGQAVAYVDEENSVNILKGDTYFVPANIEFSFKNSQNLVVFVCYSRY